MTQGGDDKLSCVQIAQQIESNNASIEHFILKDKQVEQDNVARNVGGVIPIVGLFLVASTDLSNEEQVMARSVTDRNEHLVYLAKQKGCPE